MKWTGYHPKGIVGRAVWGKPLTTACRPVSYRGAFTLVELLLVIVIITVLVALLWPVFGSMRQQAYRVQCIANQRQIGYACMLYAGDNTGSLVPLTLGGDANNYAMPNAWEWFLALVAPATGRTWAQGYTNRPTVYFRSGCYISYDTAQKIFAGDMPPAKKRAFDGYTLSYGMNQCGAAGRTKISEVPSPAQTILIGDGNSGNSADFGPYYNGGFGQWIGFGGNGAATSWQNLHYRHGGMAIVTFVDGHTSIISPAEAANTNHWNLW